jgi:hypothetical protein
VADSVNDRLDEPLFKKQGMSVGRGFEFQKIVVPGFPVRIDVGDFVNLIHGSLLMLTV